LVQWVSLKEAWQQLRHEESGHTMFATGLALGVFIANLPVYGLQTLLSLYASRKLHLHPAPAVLAAQISTPPINIAMIATAIYIGHLIIHGAAPVWPASDFTVDTLRKTAPDLLLSWLLGSIIVGIIMAAATFLLALIVIRTMRQRITETTPDE